MPMVINTNVTSLNAQRNLDKSQGSLREAMQRLSTGIRVNSAKDDAAGLAIATRFTTQIRGLDQAVRNASDGISLAQTGESALAELTNNLQRIRELSVQSANATNSASDRAALDQEVQQRLAEVTRIASQTSFNGQKILDGSFGNAQFQVGANVGETITVGLDTGVRANQIGQISTANGTTVTATALASGDLTLQVGSNDIITVGASVVGTEVGQTDSSAFSKAAAISASGLSGVTIDATTAVLTTLTTGGIAQSATTTGAYALTINGIDVFGAIDIASGTGSSLTEAEMLDGINAVADQTGVTASLVGQVLTLTAEDGRDITTNETFVGVTAEFGAATGVDTLTKGTITLRATEALTVAGNSPAEAGLLGQTYVLDAVTLDSVDVKSVANSENTILRVDAALTTISTLRSEFGAVQNRFESTIVNLQTISENLTASRGRIEDADFASETAKLTKAQILQQAGVSILSQANQLPQSVLGLLG
ncbi:MAG: flagellin [Pseudomonadales bacterium]|nr:flagellin [Pseudomonadales bacterium]